MKCARALVLLSAAALAPPPAAHGFLQPHCAIRSCRSAVRASSREVMQAEQQQPTKKRDREVDVVVIGSGLGGLSAAAMAAKYGLEVEVLESHYHPGGVAHSFEIDGYTFDAGPSLWMSMAAPSTNPLRQVMDAAGVADEVEWIQYYGWGMHLPGDKYFFFKIGPDDFPSQLPRLGTPADLQAWYALLPALRPYLKAATSIPPLALRSDPGAVLTLAPAILKALLAAGTRVSALQGPLTDVTDAIVPRDSFLYRWLDYLAFALSGLPAEHTQAAPVIYTLAELHSPGVALDYPKGGSGAVAAALVKGIERAGGAVSLRSHVERVMVEGGRATGVVLRNGSVVRARRAVVSNTSVWDLVKLVPRVGGDDGAGGVVVEGEGLPAEWAAAQDRTPDTASFNHLHLGIDGTGLEGLNIHYSIINTWDEPIDAPLNMVIVSIPTVLDPSMAPAGKHVVHAYMAGNEPYSVWEGLKRGSPEYNKLKEERTEVLWRSLERIIPDIRQRAEVTLAATPLTHEFFNRRHRGSYGPGWKAGQGNFPGPTTPIEGLLRCGDSCLPGLGVPAVAASGMHTANTIVPVSQHLALLREMKERGFMVDRFGGF